MAVRPERWLPHIRRVACAPTPDGDTDAALLERFRRVRDEDAFAALVRRYGRLVVGVCRRVLNDAHEAEDCTQAVFLVLARTAASIRRPETLAAWLHGTAHRLALRCRRADLRRRAREARARRDRAERPRSDPLDELTARELLRIFDEELRRLPDVYRLPILLCCVEGLSQEEAAERLGWSPGSLKGRLERGRRQLQARLSRRGVTLSAALVALEFARAGAAGLPARLAQSTAAAAHRVAAGRSITGVVSPRVASLTEGFLKTMLMTKLKVALALLLGLVVVAAGAVPVHQALATQQTGPAEPEPPPADGHPSTGTKQPRDGKAPRTEEKPPEVSRSPAVDRPPEPAPVTRYHKVTGAIRVPTGLIGNATRECWLYVSEDQGKSYRKVATAKPSLEDALFGLPYVELEFKATRDGAYLCKVLEIEPDSPRYPETLRFARPSVKVVLDTKPPELAVKAAWVEAGKARVEWEARDDNLNPASLRLEYRPVGEREWITLPVKPVAKGSHDWTPKVDADVEVRIEVRDLADNQTVRVVFVEPARPD
jgi:RNA polymerase sigma factor (sigma-70 family)